MTAPVDRAVLLRLFGALLGRHVAEAERDRHRFQWLKQARPDQLPPGEPGSSTARRDWRVWFVQAGRGWGKTRTGAEAVRAQVAQGRRRRVALVAPTLTAGRQIMIEGPSGILSISPPHERPRWIENRRELHWPGGATGYLYTSEEPERLRGPEHDYFWADEIGAWRNALATWKNLRLGLRIAGPLHDRPQGIVTTTPRNTELVRLLLGMAKTEITRGTTYDNRANLDPDFFDAIREEFEGTRLGEQEIQGKLLTDTPGALWKMSLIDKHRVLRPPDDLLRLVVAVDPPIADPEARREAAETEIFTAEAGIVIAARARCLCKGREEQHAFIMGDLSGHYGPEEWGQKVVDAYFSNNADRVVAEVNNGGALVEANIRAQATGRRIHVRSVHASRGKATRAEPIASLADKGMIHHCGVFPKLEDQLTTWNPLVARRSPDRLDAYVWAGTDLMLDSGGRIVGGQPGRLPVAAGGTRRI